MKTERADARDVLDPNAKTSAAFRARIIGHFVRAGPNAWDDYVFEPVDGGELVDIMADVPVQVEADGTAFRMRRHGEVLRLEWLPDEADRPESTDRRADSLARFVRPWGEDCGRGAAAVIAEKLSEHSSKPSLD